MDPLQARRRLTQTTAASVNRVVRIGRILGRLTLSRNLSCSDPEKDPTVAFAQRVSDKEDQPQQISLSSDLCFTVREESGVKRAAG